ncbi:MAG TPA: dihydrofolate reductase family protein [Candidatus Acidoferrales bacterium]|nr:dihydrofolate reductase family protein [Candidatus Acidoferrales bacterium]
MTASTRMALQMLVALVLAFAVGMTVFPQHWSWVVLTAFILCSGALGSDHAIYRGLLRLGGAIGGTLIAAIVTHFAISGPLEAALIFVVLFIGMWLRQANYAYWAACTTLIFALLQGSQGEPVVPLFTMRLAGIVAGGICAVLATSFVYPIRTEQIARRRVADALGAMRGVLKGEGDRDLEHHLKQIEDIAPVARMKRLTYVAHTHALLVHMRGDAVDRKHVADELRRLGGVLRERKKVRVWISVAVSLDGYIDDRSPERLVLSSPEDLADVRAAREQCDAILVGAETVRRDNPSLRGAKLARVTVTQSGNLDASLRFFDGSVRTIVLAAPDRVDTLRVRLGDRAEVVALERFDPPSILAALADCRIGSLFVEGGTRVLTAFLAAGLFDRLRVAVAPFFVGDSDAPRLAGAAPFLNDAHRRLMLRMVRKLGDVAVLEYEHPKA